MLMEKSTLFDHQPQLNYRTEWANPTVWQFTRVLDELQLKRLFLAIGHVEFRVFVIP